VIYAKKKKIPLDQHPVRDTENSLMRNLPGIIENSFGPKIAAQIYRKNRKPLTPMYLMFGS